MHAGFSFPVLFVVWFCVAVSMLECCHLLGDLPLKEKNNAARTERVVEKR